MTVLIGRSYQEKKSSILMGSLIYVRNFVIVLNDLSEIINVVVKIRLRGSALSLIYWVL